MRRALSNTFHLSLVVLSVAGSAALVCAQTTSIATSGPVTRREATVVPDASVDWPMHTDPLLKDSPLVLQFAPRLLDLWLEALGRPDGDSRRAAADSIADVCRRGMPAVSERAGAPLLKTLDTPGQDALVKLSCIQALIAIDKPGCAASLLAHAQSDGLETVLLVDPALVRWGYQPARDVWLARLADPKASRGAVISSLESLGAVGEPKAAIPARQLMRDASRDAGLRLAAARTLAKVSEANEDDARELYTSPGAATLDRLMAASVLAKARDNSAQRLLLPMCRDAEPAVVAIALRRVIELDPALVSAINRDLSTNTDISVRVLTVDALQGQETPESVALLAKLLGDPSVKVRTAARQALVALDAKTPLRSTVRAELQGVLAASEWRSLEQAALALGAVNEKGAADRLVVHLDSDRSEVVVAAAVGLRRLEIPATAGLLLDRATRLTHSWQTLDSQTAAGQQMRENIDAQLGQILQALAQLRHQPAEGLCMKLLPKDSSYGALAREAACWSLGRVHPATANDPIISALSARARDNSVLDPEILPVRVASAISIGRLRDKGQLSALQSLYKNDMNPRELRIAARWSIHEISGQWPGELPANVAQPSGWFLEPN